VTSSPPTTGLQSINHLVVLMLENRSFDHMLGFLYSAQGNVSPTGAPFEGLTGQESNLDANGNPVVVSQVTSSTPNLYYSPGADPGEGYSATNVQLFGGPEPSGQPTNSGFVKDYAATLAWETKDPSWRVWPGTVDTDIMTMFTPATLPVLSGLARGLLVFSSRAGNRPATASTRTMTSPWGSSSSTTSTTRCVPGQPGRAPCWW
jgi:phospholipase C